MTSPREKYHEDRCFGTEGQPQPGHIFVFISASSQHSVPAVFWRVDRLAVCFHNQFKRIHEDESIDDGDKFQYLIQATTPKSRARDIVESFPVTPENYRKTFEYLRTRFGQEDVLIQVYVRKLLKLVLQNTEVKKVNLPSLYDKIEAQLRALESSGVTKEKYAAMLFPLVESCLPAEILRAWER
ncbi:histone H3.3 [Trichonephila clavipes]|nr:histone H3.3 [Trichonephila clavipes]